MDRAKVRVYTRIGNRHTIPMDHPRISIQMLPSTRTVRRKQDTFMEEVPLLGLGDKELLKYVSLVALTLQNALVGLSMCYVRTRSGDMFLSSTAVFMAEVVKLITYLFMVFFEGDFFNVKIIKQPRDTLTVCVPSLVYVIENNLLYVSVSNLDAATYQWGALVIFLFGVIFMQLAQSGPKAVPSGIEHNHLLGFTAALTACFLFGFAAIYFKKF